MRWRVAALGALVLAVVAFAWRARPRELQFAASFAEALREAQEGGDWVVAHVRRADRPLGTRMDEQSLPERDVRASAHAGFVHVRVDAAREPELAERLAGRGAALAIAVTDARGEPVALLPGFASGATLVDFLQRVRERRAHVEATLARLAANDGDHAARLDLVETLLELGALPRAEIEVERVHRDLDAPGASVDALAEMPRALSLQADVLAARGQDAEAARLRQELGARYPASPFAISGRKRD